MNTKKITQHELTSYVSKISRDIILSEWKPDLIVGLTRGGLIPAVMLSHYFNIPMKALHVALRDFPDTCSDLDLADQTYAGLKVLIVDDINDTGATFKWILNDWRSSAYPDDDKWNTIWHDNVRFAVIADNYNSNFRVNYAGFNFDKSITDIWFEFPYDHWWI